MCGSWFSRAKIPDEMQCPHEEASNMGQVSKAPSLHEQAPNVNRLPEVTRRQPQLPDGRTCVSCFNVGPTPGTPLQGWPVLLPVPCGHVYCKPCIAKRCSLGLKDRKLVPAHCCGLEFPTEYVKDALGPSGFSTYSRFLRERNWRTSSLRSDVEYASTVARLRGVQCPNCGIGVTKIDGCAVMWCVCGNQFNYKYRQEPCPRF